jgi:uncharacterized phiE125 gp8 family phage protein
VRFYEFSQRGNLRYRSIKRIEGPSVEPVSISEAKDHLRIDQGFGEDDLYIQSLITAARTWVENAADRTLIRSRWQIKFDMFPSWDIELRRPPVMSDPIEVTYVQSNTGDYTPVQFTDFRTDLDSEPEVIRPQWDGSWPTTRGAENDVTIKYWAGYGDSGESVPAAAKHVILMLVGHWYSTREAVVAGGMNPVPMAVEALMGTINWGQYR